MTNASTLMIEIEPGVADKLATLAQHHGVDASTIAAEAIARRVDEELEFLDFIQAGEDSIARGDYLTQDEMEAWFAQRHKTADAA
jgi:predicted transcriptional regulator